MRGGVGAVAALVSLVETRVPDGGAAAHPLGRQGRRGAAGAGGQAAHVAAVVAGGRAAEEAA